MKNILFLLLFISAAGFGQGIMQPSARNELLPRTALDIAFRLPRACNPTAAPNLLNITGSNARGALVYDTCTLQLKAWNGTTWELSGTTYTDAQARAAISLTTTGTTGAATYNNGTGVLNVPQYSGGGVTTMAAIGSSPNANGASISGTTLTLQPADHSFGGVITTTNQIFKGYKMFDSVYFKNPGPPVHRLNISMFNDSLGLGGIFTSFRNRGNSSSVSNYGLGMHFVLPSLTTATALDLTNDKIAFTWINTDLRASGRAIPLSYLMKLSATGFNVSVPVLQDWNLGDGYKLTYSDGTGTRLRIRLGTRSGSENVANIYMLDKTSGGGLGLTVMNTIGDLVEGTYNTTTSAGWRWRYGAYASGSATPANDDMAYLVQREMFIKGSLLLTDNTYNASSNLTGNSTTQGWLPNRLTSAQRNAISSPATGLFIYCTDCTAIDGSTGVMQTWNGSTWKSHW